MEPPDASSLVYDKNPDVTPKLEDIPLVANMDEKRLAHITKEMQAMFEVADDSCYHYLLPFLLLYYFVFIPCHYLTSIN